MAKLNKKFSTDDHEEMSNFDALDAGDYHVKVKSSEIKDTKVKIEAKEAGKKVKGTRLSFQFEVVSGKAKGRILFANLNIENENEDTVRMADEEFTSILLACGKRSVEDTDELNGIELMMSVRVKPKTAKYPAQNVATGYAPMKGSAKPSSGGKDKKKGKKKKAKVSFDD